MLDEHLITSITLLQTKTWFIVRPVRKNSNQVDRSLTLSRYVCSSLRRGVDARGYEKHDFTNVISCFFVFGASKQTFLKNQIFLAKSSEDDWEASTLLGFQIFRLTARDFFFGYRRESISTNDMIPRRYRLGQARKHFDTGVRVQARCLLKSD